MMRKEEVKQIGNMRTSEDPPSLDFLVCVFVDAWSDAASSIGIAGAIVPPHLS